MKKFLLSLFLAGIFYSIGSAQNAKNYSFTAVSGTFNQITGTNPTIAGTGGADDGYFNGIPIGFSFMFAGTNYTTVAASTNGFISFNGTLTSSFNANMLYSGGMRPLVAPLWDDLDLQDASNFSYITTGTAPNRIFTAQWLNEQWNCYATGNSISFQVLLYEGTNVIEFVYRQESGTLSSPTASIGIAGTANGDLVSLSNASTSPSYSTSSATDNINTRPANGQIYRFSPPSLSAPASFIATSASSTQVNLNWVKNIANDDVLVVWNSTSSFGIPANGNSYNLGDLIPGGGTVLYKGSLSTFNHNNLSPSTKYYYRLYSLNSNNYSSELSANATTFCPEATLPYSQGFEGITNDNILPTCMSATNFGTRTETYASYQSAFLDAHTGNKFATFAANANDYPSDDWFFTEPISLTAGQAYEFSLWYEADGLSGWNTLEAKYGDAQSSSAMINIIPGASVTNPINSEYQKMSGIFTPSQSGTYFIGIHGTSNGNPWYLSIDDLLLTSTSSCLYPNNLNASGITANSANLSWDENGSATQWQIEYGIAGFTQGAGTKVFANTNPFAIGTLSATTDYDFYVRAICGAGDTSVWSPVYSFTSACVASSIPYFESFESILDFDQLPSCMSSTDLGNKTTTYNQSLIYNRTPHSGISFASFAYSSDDWFYTQPLILVGGQEYEFSCWYITDGDYGWSVLEAKYGDAQNSTSMLTAIAGAQVTNIGNSTYQKLSGTFTPSTSGTYNIGIHCVSGIEPNFLSIDDISVQEHVATAIENHSENFALYPNPSNGNVTIDFRSITGTVQVDVYSVTGQCVYTKLISSQSNTLNLSDLVEGVYTVTVTTGNSISNQRFVKTK